MDAWQGRRAISALGAGTGGSVSYEGIWMKREIGEDVDTCKKHYSECQRNDFMLAGLVQETEVQCMVIVLMINDAGCCPFPV